MSNIPNGFNLLVSADNANDLCERIKAGGWTDAVDKELLGPYRKLAEERRVLSKIMIHKTASDLFVFPVQVYHGDKPDFLINDKHGTTGIEVVRIVSERAAMAHDMARKNSMEIHFVPSSRESTRRPARGKESGFSKALKDGGSPTYGDEQELEIAKVFCQRILEKTTKIVDYHKADRFYIFAYDDFGFRDESFIKSSGAADQIRKCVDDSRPHFDRILVLRLDTVDIW